jgi:hypothetical protein
MNRLQQHRYSPFILLLTLFWSVMLGLGLARATDASPIGTVDPVPPRYQLGQQVYLENCATCHIGIPPATLPDETWRRLLQDSQHYGQQITPLVDPPRLLVWNYLLAYSRPIQDGETIPYRVNDSRYFKALHPRVELPQPVRLNSCAVCHPGATQYDFRRLTSEWQNAS